MYKVQVRRQAMKDIAALPQGYPRLVAREIDTLAENPRPQNAKKLKGETGYRLRVGVYRVLYEIDDHAETVTVYRVKHRREAYR